MKSFVCTLILVSCAFLVNAENAELFLTDVFEAQKRSQDTEKNIFVYYFEKACTFCEIADDSLFTDQDIRKYLTENFISVKADYGNKLYATWYDKYNVTCLPTMQIISPEGDLLYEIKGITSSEEFMYALVNYDDISETKEQLLLDSALVEEEIESPVTEIEENLSADVKKTIEDDAYYTVQLGAFRVFDNVLNYRRKLEQEHGLILSIHESSDEQLYRIFLGEFTSKEQAETSLQEVKDLSIEYWFRSVSPSLNYFELQLQ